jgi:hypothetical protein
MDRLPFIADDVSPPSFGRKRRCTPYTRSPFQVSALNPGFMESFRSERLMLQVRPYNTIALLRKFQAFGHPLTIACSMYSNSSTVRAWICSMETPTKPLRSLICCCCRRTVCSLPDIQRAGLRSSVGRTCQARGRRRSFCRCSRSSRCRKPCRCSRSRRCRELGFECS